MSDQDATSTASAGSETLVPLGPKLRLREAEALLTALRAVPASDVIVFEAEAVEELSTPAALVIASAVSHAKTTPPAAIIRPSDAFVAAFTDLDLFPMLMKMEMRP